MVVAYVAVSSPDVAVVVAMADVGGSSDGWEYLAHSNGGSLWLPQFEHWMVGISCALDGWHILRITEHG